MDTNLYLERIGFTDTVGLDYETLKKLQSCHLYSVPYENLDILTGTPVKLDRESLFEKIVLKKRGGYCFELNGLFGALLRELGFAVTDCMARFLKGETQIPMRRHRVLKVDAKDGLFLCDVGVGMISPTVPVRLDTEEIQYIDKEAYQITRDGFLGTVLHQCFEGTWDRFFSFTDEPQLDIDFVMPSFWCEKHPDSPFIKGDMLALYTPYGGKNSISGDALTYWDEDGKHKMMLETETEKRKAYEKYFGIVL